jgi:anti-anti-sigma regulatory factor
MALCGLNEQPSELLAITQLDKIFTISEVCNY